MLTAPLTTALQQANRIAAAEKEHLGSSAKSNLSDAYHMKYGEVDGFHNSVS